MTVASILRQKGNSIVHVSPTTTVADVTSVLARHNIGALLVRDAAGQVLGILSERDIARNLACHGAGTLAMTAAQLMTTDLVLSHPHDTTEHALRLMTEGRFRHLPVYDGTELCGLISIGDVVKARLSEQACEVDSLRAYVSGG